MSRGMRRREARGKHWNEAQCVLDIGMKTKSKESPWKT